MYMAYKHYPTATEAGQDPPQAPTFQLLKQAPGMKAQPGVGGLGFRVFRDPGLRL